MIPITLAEVAAITAGTLGGGVAEPGSAAVVTSVEIDSRAVAPGCLFVALPGEHHDGHDYLDAAARAGAVAALVSREVDDPPLPCVQVPDTAAGLADLAREVLARLRAADDVVVVGITGSVGKTSTKDLLSVLLTPLGPVVAPVASFNNEIGLPLTVLRADERTRVLVLEMGADAPGNLTFLTSVAPPDVAVELIVGHAHLGGFGSIDGVARAKAELVQGLRRDGVAVLNADDPRVSAMAPLAPRVTTFGRSGDADVRALDVTVDDEGHARFVLAAGEERLPVRLGLAGEHHVTNALAAATVALHLGLPLAHVVEELAAAAPISPHRMQVTDSADGIRVVDDAYNANPTSMRAGLRALAAMTAGERRAVAVLGEMLDLGPDSGREHAEIGAYAAELGIEEVVAVGAGTAPLLAAAVAGGSGGHHAADVDEAEQLLRGLLRPGDVVLVKASNGVGLSRIGDALATGALGAATP
ncbi:MAG TPA: UDP-N-acetylmuramoyl-tripeptide--D-alanyl-D-alanine ligase [Actinotalea caeni]|uniref:UDP-N-acetylmuramoyl-tripeptide--D-alanyl-D- alanine ligase n=1 Tax=Actinotalea caeni TaxID=1348467 RepID=UPI0012E23B89|nr:UDP-N-acetylmuramoyl-tripeptide--D-alanyl-D-alanine ligase [Actinotalea caeni]HLV56644.1 UDP-N-acetylmuramoyl-tripeptide--D-alanyl-D-alanine ligase [Actinotalea caeni]